MQREWTRFRVSELISSQKLLIGDGYRAKNTELSTTGLPFARAGNISNGFNFAVSDYFPRENLGVVGNKHSLPGDVVFTSKGTVGRFAFVREDSPQFVYSPQLCFWRSLDDQVIDSRFLYYWMQGREFYTQYKSVSSQTDMAEYVSLTDQRRMHITLPPIDEQRSIGDILGTLDDKIEINRRMNDTLEELAGTLFRSWLAENTSPRTTVADLIRDGLLEVGDGYRAKNSELGDSGLPFIRAGNLHNGFDTTSADLLSMESVARAANKVSRVGDVAFTSKGTVGRFARVTRYNERFVYSPQVCYWRSLDDTRLHPAILYCWMQSEDLRSQILSVAAQTDMAPYVSLRDQRRMSVPIFPASQHEVAGQIEFLLTRAALSEQETKTLTSIRDTLLPQLLSGELQVEGKPSPGILD